MAQLPASQLERPMADLDLETEYSPRLTIPDHAGDFPAGRARPKIIAPRC